MSARTTTHVIDPVVGRRINISAGVPQAGNVAYVIQCTGCPWHAKNPVAFRVAVAQQALPEIKVGSTLTIGRVRHPNADWGVWIVRGIVTGQDKAVQVVGKADQKDKGINPQLWVIAPYTAPKADDKPAEQPAAADAAAKK